MVKAEMFHKRRGKRRFPYFSGYLEVALANPPASVRDGSENVAAGFATGAWIMGAVALAIASPGIFTALGFVGACILSPAVFAVARSLFKRLKRPKSEDEVREFEYWRSVRGFSSLDQQSKLHKWCDPNAAQLLEVAAFHWTRIKTALDGPYWQADGIPVHWAAVREQASSAADRAIHELVITLSPCIGAPQRERSDDVKGVVDDLFDLSLSEALDGFRQLSKGDWTRYAHQSPHIGALYDPARELVERLLSLADEIEARTEDIQADVRLSPTQGAANAIDVVISEMRSVREAEEELHEQA